MLTLVLTPKLGGNEISKGNSLLYLSFFKFLLLIGLLIPIKVPMFSYNLVKFLNWSSKLLPKLIIIVNGIIS